MKKILIAIVIVILIAVALIYFAPVAKPAVTPAAPVQPAADSTTGINADLQSVDTGDVDTDIKSLDSDINTL